MWRRCYTCDGIFIWKAAKSKTSSKRNSISVLLLFQNWSRAFYSKCPTFNMLEMFEIFTIFRIKKKIRNLNSSDFRAFQIKMQIPSCMSKTKFSCESGILIGRSCYYIFFSMAAYHEIEKRENQRLFSSVPNQTTDVMDIDIESTKLVKSTN